MEPVITIHVHCLEPLYVKGAASDVCMIPFTCTAEGIFKGSIIGNGVDTQKIAKDGSMQLSARYMLEGTDFLGAPCRLFIENEGSFDGGFCPKVVTDSPSLSYLETARLSASIESGDAGLLIRIFNQHV